MGGGNRAERGEGRGRGGGGGGGPHLSLSCSLPPLFPLPVPHSFPLTLFTLGLAISHILPKSAAANVDNDERARGMVVLVDVGVYEEPLVEVNWTAVRGEMRQAMNFKETTGRDMT